ncbi:hypothetical protein TFLX_04569 [Thermoflexales bacterium]|nr:hypothetical protein TFLX_04569 [Thermoflexales bacterium]
MNGLRRETIQGRPLRVGDREIVPEAEVWSVQTKQIGLKADGLSGGGVWWSWARPTALIERGSGVERRVQITDVNLHLEIVLLIAALVLPVVLTIFTRWANRSSAA